MILAPIILCFLTSVFAEMDYSCSLKWVPEGHGNIPQFAISQAPGEYIARVFLTDEDQWRVGRLIPEEGKTWFTFPVDDGQHVAEFSDTYEVLTNPEKCLISWTPTFGSQIPQYSVPSDEKGVSYVGRASVAGFVMGGSVDPSFSYLFIAYEGKVYSRRYFEILTSTFPLLNMVVSNFRYPSIDLRIMRSKENEEIIDTMELITNTDSSSIVYPVVHQKQVQETYIIAEKLGWEGVGNITIEMNLWFGSPTVVAEHTNLHLMEGIKKIMHKRTREIIVDRTITVAASSSPKSNQICSSVKTLTGQRVKFEAIAKVTSPNMRSDQVKELLKRSGRSILHEGGDILDEEDYVLAKISGFLTGSFVTGVKSYFDDLEGDGACSGIIKNGHRNF